MSTTRTKNVDFKAKIELGITINADGSFETRTSVVNIQNDNIQELIYMAMIHQFLSEMIEGHQKAYAGIDIETDEGKKLKEMLLNDSDMMVYAQKFMQESEHRYMHRLAEAYNMFVKNPDRHNVKLFSTIKKKSSELILPNSLERMKKDKKEG